MSSNIIEQLPLILSLSNFDRVEYPWEDLVGKEIIALEDDGGYYQFGDICVVVKVGDPLTDGGRILQIVKRGGDIRGRTRSIDIRKTFLIPSTKEALTEVHNKMIDLVLGLESRLDFLENTKKVRFSEREYQVETLLSSIDTIPEEKLGEIREKMKEILKI